MGARTPEAQTPDQPAGRRPNRPVRWGVAAAGAGYACWASGLRPFTATAYVAIAVPVAALALTEAAGLGRGGPVPTGAPAPVAGRPSGRALAPWMVFLAVAAALETAGLALGGRSATVPTLSTVVDHALGERAVRAALFAAWLVVGWAPAWRRAREPGETPG